MEKEIIRCEECGSEYYAETSIMQSLCPECAHKLYGYPNCSHVFENGRCKLCYWDGSRSEFLKNAETGDTVPGFKSAKERRTEQSAT